MNRHERSKRKVQLRSLDLLFKEVASRTEDVTDEHLDNLVSVVSHHYESPEKALEAIRSGAVQLEQVEKELQKWQDEQWDKAFMNLVRLGLFEEVRDEHGNVITEPGRDGKLQILWRRTEKDFPKNAALTLLNPPRSN
jgi:hypothetical protein